MSKIITLRKGLDINLRERPRSLWPTRRRLSEYALSPLDFEGVTPKLLVKVGDEVKAGTPLFFNKVQRACPLHVACQRDGCCRQPRGEAQRCSP